VRARPSRREFLWTAASAVAAANVRGNGAAAPGISAAEIIARIRDKVGVAWRTPSADGIKAGSDETLVTGVVTTVMATADVLKRAAAGGRNLVLTQEPTFYPAADDGGAAANDPVYALKKSLIDERHIVIWRFSEHWNARRPSEPIAALANTLGWSAFRQPDVEGLFKVPEIRLDALLQHVRTRLHLRGGLRWLGPSDMPIRTVLLSPGTTDLASSVARMPRADAIIAGEPREWEAVPYVLDMRPRKALLAVGRVASLEPNAAACAAWIRSLVNEVPVDTLATGDPYWSPAFAPGAPAEGPS
jgi:putative NIF3 family GTP cyclohydrolase 1 type 2